MLLAILRLIFYLISLLYFIFELHKLTIFTIRKCGTIVILVFEREKYFFN